MYNIKSFGFDSLDREHIQVGKMSFTIIEKIPFKSWIEKNYGKYENFMFLKDKDKEKIFLRWKHGLSEEANFAIESTDKHLISLYKMRNLNEIEDEGSRYAIQNKLSFENSCNRIKEEIGLLKNKRLDNFSNEIAERGFKDYNGDESI